MAFELTDDGTMDTVVRCSECGEELRYNFDPALAETDDGEVLDEIDPAIAYSRWVDSIIEDAESDHECLSDDDGDAAPQEDDITTSDHRNFYQSGKLAFSLRETVDEEYILCPRGVFPSGEKERFNATYDTIEEAIRVFMDADDFFPNCWFISDHGNAHRMDLSDKA